MEFGTFLGRFHPVVVHLPIGFILGALLLEGLFRNRHEKSKSIVTLWMLGFVGAALACISGYMLEGTGLYLPEELNTHKWLGYAMLPITFIGWLLKKGTLKPKPLFEHAFGLTFLILLVIQGHLGGSLTHGADYLGAFAPEPLKSWLGSGGETALAVNSRSPDSLGVYEDLIHPVFDRNCVACHNDETSRGGLDMSRYETLMVGGDNGAVLVPGKASKSEVFHRITLPPSSTKFMPPTNEVLSYDEIKIIEWWIENGAPKEAFVSQIESPSGIAEILLRSYGIDTSPRPWYEKVVAPMVDSLTVMKARALGFSIKPLGENNALLDVSFPGGELTGEALQGLSALKPNVTWLSLTNATLEDGALTALEGFENLTRLELDKTNVTERGVEAIGRLPHLEALNLYGSRVGDSIAQVLSQFPELKRIYLSETEVSADGVAEIRGQLPDLKVFSNFGLLLQ